MHLSRRETLVCGLVLAGAAGCRAGATTPIEQTTDPTAGDETDGDLDDALLSRVRAALAARLLAIAGAGSQYPVLAGPLAGLEQMHLAHRTVLDPEAPDPDPGSAAARTQTRSAVAQRLLDGEADYRDLLARSALAARSGALARALASASASVSQHLPVAAAGLMATGVPVTAPTEPAISDLPDLPAAAGDSAVEAWQITLTAEHAAIYLYGVLGARTSQSAAPAVFGAIGQAYAEHRVRRDALTGWISAAGVEPVSAAVAYAVPEPTTLPGAGLDTVVGLSVIARSLESAGATTYGALVGSTSGEARGVGLDWMRAAALRELALRGTPEAFPGGGGAADGCGDPRPDPVLLPGTGRPSP